MNTLEVDYWFENPEGLLDSIYLRPQRTPEVPKKLREENFKKLLDKVCLPRKRPREENSYQKKMRKHTFSYYSSNLGNPPTDPIFTKRISQEIRNFSRNLPCHENAAIFVKVNESNIQELQAVLTGVLGTPYQNGLFHFSIKLPNDYPMSPPRIRLTNTGRVMRFNPKLYANGTVCLSILNTWEGSAGESWNPITRNVAGLLVCIQSLVMDSNIVQKEPSFETMSPECLENKAYQTIVKYGTIKYAMVNMLKNPPEEFKELVKAHFKNKKEEIITQVLSYVEEADQFNPNIVFQNRRTANELARQGPKTAFMDTVNDLIDLLSEID